MRAECELDGPDVQRPEDVHASELDRCLSAARARHTLALAATGKGDDLATKVAAGASALANASARAAAARREAVAAHMARCIAVRMQLYEENASLAELDQWPADDARTPREGGGGALPEASAT